MDEQKIKNIVFSFAVLSYFHSEYNLVLSLYLHLSLIALVLSFLLVVGFNINSKISLLNLYFFNLNYF